MVYDEIENFRAYNEEMFEYPYGDRKILAARNRFDTKHFEYDESRNQNDFSSFDYQFDSQHIVFQKSYVCLEEPWWNTFTDLFPKIWRVFSNKVLKIPRDTGYDCDGEEFSKLKYSMMDKKILDFQQEYSHSVMPDKILLELTLELDQFKTIS